jgi:hypothetical protein
MGINEKVVRVLRRENSRKVKNEVTEDSEMCKGKCVEVMMKGW